MAKLNQGLAWIADLVQIFALDRFHPQRRQFSLLASTACRSLKFHAHCKIPALGLNELLQRLSPREIPSVSLPGPASDLGDVGSQTYYHVLASVVRALQPKTILEFGTYLGVSALTMALNAQPECQIYTVDLPDETSPDFEPSLNQVDRGHISTSRFRVGEAFLRSTCREQITQIRADSMTFRAEDSIRQADLVLVDGGHSLPVVTKDTENAFKILSPSGVVIWDDYFHLYPDVVMFLDRLAEERTLYRIQGTNLVMHSPPWQTASRSIH